MCVTPVFSQDDYDYMARAIALAKKGLYSTKPNPAVGCVIVNQGEVVGEGWHQRAGMPHAERVALANAGAKAKGATVYVTLEPCSHHGRTPPCADGLIEAGVAQVLMAMVDPNPLVSGQGIARLKQAGIEVKTGLMEEEARNLNKGFIHKMQSQMPYVKIKMATSLDGRTAMENGESQWITGAEARADVHKMRAQTGAIVTGIGTVLADNPSLTVRLSDDELKVMNLTPENAHPLRVILDPNLSMPLDAKMLSQFGRTLVMTTKESVERSPELVEAMFAKQIEVVAVSAREDRLDVKAILKYLAEEENINDVLVESGSMVAGGFIASGYVNEIHSFIAPCLMGNKAKPMFDLPSMRFMNDKIEFQFESMMRFGEDIKLVLKPKKNVVE